MAEPDKNNSPQMLEAMSMAWDVFLAIAVPTTTCALGGRWLDDYYHTSPWFTIIGLIIALSTAYILVSRRAKDIAKRLSGPKQ